jgi:hypothetical protein
MKFRVFLQLLGLLLSGSTGVYSQGFVDNALLFSRTQPGGSARIQAMGGAQISLGGDFSSALSNPAGLGMYNRSEFTFSPGYTFTSIDSEHFGNSDNGSKNKFTIPGLSYVHNSPKNKNGFYGGSFGISMTRTNSFNSTMQYSGDDNVSSILDYFIEDVDGIPANNLNYDLPAGLAYDSYLIDDLSALGGPNNRYFSALFVNDNPDELILKRTGVNESSGAQYQWSLAYGGNFNDKLFFGANLGITTLRYKFKSTYTESDFFFALAPSFNPLDYLELEETIDIQGSGVNLTVGLIYRPLDFLQVGMSVVTPTRYQLIDTYSARLRTQWNNYNYLDSDPPNLLNFFDYQSESPLISEYSMTTPIKLSLGSAFFISNYGMISADVEFVNYSNAKYKSTISGISFDPENNAIKNIYKNVVNYRIGGEFRYEVLRFRAGYNFQSNPFVDDVDEDRSIKTASLGVGFRTKRFFGDLAWLNTKGNSTYSPYQFLDGYRPEVILANTVNTLMLTLGITF